MAFSFRVYDKKNFSGAYLLSGEWLVRALFVFCAEGSDFSDFLGEESNFLNFPSLQFLNFSPPHEKIDIWLKLFFNQIQS